MLKSPEASFPPVALGAASLILGMIGLLLFFLPILAVPVGACGAACGLGGIVAVVLRRGSSLRWSIMGLVVSCTAMAIGFALDFAPQGYIPSSAVPPLWQTPSNRPYIPPPAVP